MDALALTDRDGVYGAVRFVKACQAADIRPILGVDLAIEPTGLVPVPTVRPPAGGRAARAQPARGGSYLDHDRVHPRVTLLAGSKAGWAALCRLVSATHLRGERGVPVATRDLVADQLAGLGSGTDLLLMLGPVLRARLGCGAAPRRPGAGGPARLVRRDRPQQPGRRGDVPPPRRRRARFEPACRPDGGRCRRPRLPARPDQRGPLRRPGSRPRGRRTRRVPPPGPARPAPRRPRERRGVLEDRQGDGRHRRRDLPGRRPRRPGRRSGCSRAPATSPTGARSTPAPTSASGWRTCPSSRCGQGDGHLRGCAAAAALRRGDRAALRLRRRPGGGAEAARRRAAR